MTSQTPSESFFSSYPTIGRAMGFVSAFVANRHLLFTMVRREVGARFAGSSLGGLWTLIHPVILLSLYTMVFTYIYRVRDVGGYGFTEFIFCGLWPWMAFQDACLRSVSAITENANLVKKLQFPSELLVIAVTLASFLVQGVGFILFLVVLMLWQGSISVFSIVLLVIPLSIHIALAVGIGMIVACGNVFFRDVGQLATAGFTVWFFLTPIIYPPSLAPAALQPVLQLNPITPIVSLYRSLILSHSFVGGLWLLYCVLIAGIFLWVGAYLFDRCRGFFADYL